MTNSPAKRDSILGIKVNISHNYYLDYEMVINWAIRAESKYICCANVHMLVTAQETEAFRSVLISADLVTLDGRPLFWLLYIKSFFYYFLGYIPAKKHSIIQFCGRDVMEETIKLASILSIPIGFYGNTETVLEKLVSCIKTTYPNIKINYVFSPSYRPLSEQEDADIITAVNKSGIRILFVSLGCPKQEYWMHDKRNLIQAVMFGVGGAFDIIANAKPRPSKLMQFLGLEWLFRLWLEPRRLLWRNLYYSPKFILILSRRIICKSFRYLLSKVNIKTNLVR